MIDCFYLISVISGYIIDLIFGDPYYFPHPIRLMGNFISKGEEYILKYRCKNKIYLFISGMILSLFLMILSFAIPFYILKLFSYIDIHIRILAEAYLCYTMLAAKSLKYESMKVYYALKDNNIEDARLKLSYIVGRDTYNLDKKHIINASIETVAENTSDGVIAPLFFMVLGGAPFAFLYKAVNTLDSMIGYKNEKYLYFGKFAAITDDIFNYIPSRISAYIMILASYIINLDYKNAYKIFKRDRFNHSSPNSAQTESVCAGALNIMLGGDSYYFGKLFSKKYIGDDLRQCTEEDIKISNKLMYFTSILALIIFILAVLFIRLVI